MEPGWREASLDLHGPYFRDGISFFAADIPLPKLDEASIKDISQIYNHAREDLDEELPYESRSSQLFPVDRKTVKLDKQDVRLLRFYSYTQKQIRSALIARAQNAIDFADWSSLHDKEREAAARRAQDVANDTKRVPEAALGLGDRIDWGDERIKAIYTWVSIPCRV